jgi:SAM-dependent methyltransferase
MPIASLDRDGNPLPTDLCTACGLFFTNPMPTEAALAAYYRSAYRAEYVDPSNRPPDDYVADRKAEAARRASIVRTIIDPDRDRRTLDFGCGLGELVVALANSGYEAHGFEPGEVWSQHTGNPRVRQGDWQTADYADGSFDFVSIIHVLEHLRRPLDCLTKIERLLKSDGLLWIEVPDMQAYARKNHKRFHFAHVLGFSRDNLIAAAQRCGFTPVRFITRHEIGKRRDQVSIVFRKARPGDVIAIDLAATVARNRKDYGTRSPLREAWAGAQRWAGSALRLSRPGP